MRIACTGPRILREEALEKAPPDIALENLKDLVRINRWFGGHRIIQSLLPEFVDGHAAFTVLDVGAASGDMGRAIRSAYPNARIISLDRKTLHLSAAAAPRVAADAFQLPFPSQGVDIVFCSLFLHHFDNSQAVALLRHFAGIARRAVIVIDLERHPLAYYFLPATRWLFRWGELVLNDGKISVEAAWKPAELQRLAQEAGLLRARVRRHLPWFRLSLTAAV
jgi:2-polyprenyl-3-methyl-5-hydroxy-6-metoxy-1,4-benzoquinol methylase